MKAIQHATDSNLVSQYIAGNEAAFEALVLKYKNKVFSTIFMIVKDKYKAEDLLQDTFIKAINVIKEGKYNDEGKFGPWVTRMGYNLAIDNFRKKKRYPTIPTENSDPVFNSMEFTEESIEAVQIKNDTHQRLRQLIDELPESQRDVLMMRHYAEMSFQEIAEKTGVSINTSLGRMRYALMNLRKMMQQTNLKYDRNLYS